MMAAGFVDSNCRYFYFSHQKISAESTRFSTVAVFFIEDDGYSIK
jgi:hypothetical protein